MVFQFDGQLAKGLLCRFVPVTKFSIIILSCHLLLSLKETKQYQFCCDFERLVSNLVERQEELFLSRKMQLVIIKNSLKIYSAELLFQSFIYIFRHWKRFIQYEIKTQYHNISINVLQRDFQLNTDENI